MHKMLTFGLFLKEKVELMLEIVFFKAYTAYS